MRSPLNDSRVALASSLALSSLALVLIFWGLSQVDLPVIWFMRSVHLLWLQRAGDLANNLGDGWILVLISACLLAVGLAFRLPSFRAAGIWSLVAHAAAGVAVQLLKRLVGRPRPRFTHSDEIQLAPSLISGFDSFPSGHATASFAVATILARYFPRVAWLLFGLGGLVGLARVVRGSHFPSDVAVGAVLGVLIGLLITNPLGGRWKSIAWGLAKLVPWLAAAFGLLWLAVHPYEGGWIEMVALLLGAGLMLAGLGSRLWRRLRTPDGPGWLPSVSFANGLIALGIAISTGSLLLTSLGTIVALAQWIPSGESTQASALGPSPGNAHLYLTEGTVAGLSCLALGAAQVFKGVLPLL